MYVFSSCSLFSPCCCIAFYDSCLFFILLFMIWSIGVLCTCSLFNVLCACECSIVAITVGVDTETLHSERVLVYIVIVVVAVACVSIFDGNQLYSCICASWFSQTRTHCRYIISISFKIISATVCYAFDSSESLLISSFQSTKNK